MTSFLLDAMVLLLLHIPFFSSPQLLRPLFVQTFTQFHDDLSMTSFLLDAMVL
eukprot:CAMPEP_0194482944 /NCGR_PEP_ID=MMETSP0253-20130528/4683_1 /TAXON_ID=2966 /ORGANISM="Noctiluca scintillans" /LENGTH=52 /DNA_ID=CAMNT_0039322525 /DNA_START=43 /DNA_END=197 /DNA_ORIENTATION=+